jgi:hypothetical protein
MMDESFLISPDELKLEFANPAGERKLSFKNTGLPFGDLHCVIARNEMTKQSLLITDYLLLGAEK